MREVDLPGLDRYVFFLNLLWFKILVGSTALIALGMWVALGYGVEVGPGPSEAVSSTLRYLSASIGVSVVVGLALFRDRLFSVDTMSQLDVGSGLDLGEADSAVKRAAAQLGRRIFITVSVAEIPAIVLIATGLMENALKPFLLAAGYCALISLIFRPSIRELMEALVDRQLNER